MSVMLGRLAEVNPPVPELDALSDEALVTFMPLDACWPDGRADTTRRAAKSTIASGYTRFKDGDVLLPKITPTFEAGRVFPARIQTVVGAATTEVHVLRARSGAERRFLAYICRSQPFLQEGSRNLQGVGNLRRVSTDWVRTYPVPMFDQSTQRRIADYLDRETAQIDTLIAKQEQLIATLRERRDGMRTHLATTGLHEAPESQSDLPWAKTLPEHWQVVPLTSVARLESGHTPSRSRPELWADCHIPWISLNDVASMTVNEYLSTTENLISEAGVAASSARLLPAGTVVLSRDATIGRSSIMAVPMATSQHFADWVCGPKLEQRYLWLIMTSAMQPLFHSLTNGSTLRTIGMGIIKGFKIPLPPIVEQREIVEVAHDLTEKIDTLISKAEQFISLSKERRSALITAAVTGQIDVTGKAA